MAGIGIFGKSLQGHYGCFAIALRARNDVMHRFGNIP